VVCTTAGVEIPLTPQQKLFGDTGKDGADQLVFRLMLLLEQN